jgi:O-methyltransferase domain/Dimerisation domain
MPADAPAKLPPVRLAHALDAVRRRLRRLERKLQPPFVSILDTMQGAHVAQGVYAATKLGIADALRDGPLTADAVADRVGADSDSVKRLLRALASRGVFAQHRDGRFALTPLSKSLLADAPHSARGMVLYWGDPMHWEHWGQLSSSVRTGRSAIEELRGKPAFDWLPDVPELAAVFNDGMTSMSTMETPLVVAAYNFSRFGTIVDVGGGHGMLLNAILRSSPNARGILFDAESVVEGASTVLGAAGVADRCEVIGGSFFDSVPAGGDAYTLKHIIHDGDDEKSVQILRNIRTAMNAGAKVLIVELVIPDDDREHAAKLLDLEMLVALDGRERTEAEYAELLRQAGFRHTRTVATVGPASIVEAVAA